MSDMGPDLELKGRSYPCRETTGNKEPIGVMKELENNRLSCASNREDKSFDRQVGTNEPTKGACRSQDMGFNILDGANSGGVELTEEEKWDAELTESSSSFDSDGTSFSDTEDDAISALPFDGYSDLVRMRKRKLASSWRKFIGPLIWRCKWVELQIKKFESQAQKYERKIAEYDRRKQLENCISEHGNSVSLPFSAQSPRNTVPRRKRRRRAEDTEEIASYMSQHNLFSYFENKKSAADATGTDGNWGNQEKTSNGTNVVRVEEELISREFKVGSNSLEQIFWKIGTMQWQVNEMKTRVHKILSENAARFSSTENLSLLVSCNNSLTSSAENPASPPNYEHEITAAASSISVEIERSDSDANMVDVAIPESAALRLGEANHVEETSQPAFGGSSKNPGGTILIYNRREKTNRNKSKEVNSVSTQKREGPVEDHEKSSVIPSFEVPESSTPKSSSTSKMMTATTTMTNSFKRKRAMRKAGSGKWNR